MTSPRQLRRQARKLHRSGIQPMVIIGGNGRRPAVDDLALLRIIWRYRSELAPSSSAVAVLHCLVAARRRTRAGGQIVLSVAAAAAWALAVFGAGSASRPGSSGCTRRRSTLAAGGWLTAATAAGPVTSPLPQALILGGTVLAVPWWAHRRRRARVRIERKLEAWPEIAKAVGLPGSQVMSALVDVWGWRSRIRLARGQTITDVIAKIPALESALGTFRGAVRVYPDPR